MELQVGQKRNFSFTDDHYVISEIIQKTDIKLVWKWNDSVCPHCKEKLTREMVHTFHKIEILIKEGILEDNATTNDILLLGDALDGRKMMIPAEKYNEVFGQSQKFKKLIK